VWVIVGPGRVEPDDLEHLAGAFAGLRIRDVAMRPDRLVDLRPDGHHRVQRVHRALGDVRDLLPADLAAALLGHLQEILALEADLAALDDAVVVEQAEHGQRGGRLAGTGLADEPVVLPGRDVEGDVVDRIHLAVVSRLVGYLQVADFE
jgi:hypothetical protein